MQNALWIIHFFAKKQKQSTLQRAIEHCFVISYKYIQIILLNNIIRQIALCCIKLKKAKVKDMQMSLWGRTVITSLASALPIVGTSIVGWLRGGFAVDNPTLNRFYSFHY